MDKYLLALARLKELIIFLNSCLTSFLFKTSIHSSSNFIFSKHVNNKYVDFNYMIYCVMRDS